MQHEMNIGFFFFFWSGKKIPHWGQLHNHDSGVSSTTFVK